jgi:hypothetical protein
MVPAEAFASGGRQVRCARCRHEWYAKLPSHIDVFVAPAPVEPKKLSSSPASLGALQTEAMPTPNLPAIIKKYVWMPYVKRALLGIALIGGVVIWPLIYREPIVKAIPSLRGFYETFGLYIAHSGKGLIFDQVKSELRYDGGTMKLFVDGVVHNTTTDTQFIPDIRARALAPDKSIIQSWWVPAPAVTVGGGEDIPFHTEIVSPMQHTIEDVYLEFYAEDEKTGVSK